MDRFYSLNIQNNEVRILEIESKNDVFYLENERIIDIRDLSAFLKNKGSYYITLSQEEAIDEKIEIESAIKNDGVIKKIINAKLTESNPNKKAIFNYCPVEELKNSKKRTYQVDGIYADDCGRLLEKIDNISEIKSISTSKFALFGISCKCIKENSFFSINNFENKLIIIVVHNNTLIFSREYTITAESKEDKKKKFVEEIAQTISYVQQNFRDIKFSFIALSGTISVDDEILEHIYILSGLGVCSLYPNTFIKGTQEDHLHNIIIPLGASLVPEKYRFIPKTVLGTKQYNKILKILAVFSFAVFLAASVFAYKEYDDYEKVYREYETLENRMIELAKSAKIYSNEELSYFLWHIQTAQNYMQHHPLDSIVAIKPLIEMQKPKSIIWEHHDDYVILSAVFESSFKTLEELYDFERDFFNFFDTFDKTFNVAYQKRTNYAALYFDVTITLQNGAKSTKEISRRRR